MSTKKHLKLIRRLLLLLLLRTSRGSFLSEDSHLKSLLEKERFHVSLCSHPSILFVRKGENHYILPKKILSFVCKYLRQNYVLLTSKRWLKLLRHIGISDYFLTHFDFVAYYNNDYKMYNVPNIKLSDKIVVYTVITGTYDDVHELIYKEPEVDYILFTNNKKITSRSWQVRYVNSALDNILLSREIKMLPHKYIPEYKYSVYIDANAYIYGNIAQLTTLLTPNISFILTKHRIHTSIKEEINACIECKGISMVTAYNQYHSYLQRGFKDDLSLGECGILVRKHNDPALISLMKRWWIEYQNGIKRDQASLMACIFLEQYFHYLLIDGTVYHNQYCIIGGHKNSL